MRARHLAYVALMLTLAFAAVVAGTGWLLGTTAGARWLAAKVPGLTMEIAGGRLLDGISATALTWRTETQFIEVRDLTTHWDAECFLQWHWCISQIHAGSAKVQLQSAEKQIGDPQQTVLPALNSPIAVSIDTVRVGPVTLTHDSGQYVLDAMNARLQLSESMLRIDHFRIRHARGEATLRGHVELRGDYPLEVQLDANGREPIDERRVTLKSSVKGSMGELQLAAVLRADDTNVTVQGELRPLEAEPQYTLTLESPRLVAPSDLALDLTVRDSTLKLMGKGSDYRIRLDTRLDAGALQDALLQLQASGDLESVQIQQLRLRSTLADAHSTGRLTLTPELTWQGEIVIDKLQLGSWIEQVQQPVRGRATVDVQPLGEVWRVGLTELQVDSSVAENPFVIEGALTGYSDGRWDTPGLVVDSLGNRLSVVGNGRYDVAQSVARYALDVRWDALQWPPAGVAEIRGGVGNLHIRGRNDEFSVTGNTSYSSNLLPDAHVQLQVDGNRTAISINELNVMTLGGALNVRGGLRLDEALHWQARAEFEDINPAQQWPELVGRLQGSLVADGSLTKDNWAIAIHDFALQGDFLGEAIEAEAKAFADATGLLRLDRMLLRSGGNRVSARGEHRDTWAVSVTADLPEIQTLIPHTKGAVLGEFTIAGALDRPDVTLDVRARDLTFDNIHIGESHVIATLRQFGYADSELRVEASEVQREGRAIDSLTLHASGTLAEHAIDFRADGQPLGVAATLQGKLAESLIDWSGALLTAQVRVPGSNWTLASPAELSWSHANRRVELRPHCWHQVDATLCVSEPAIVGATGDVSLRLAEFDVAALNELLAGETELGGTLNATARLQWSSTYEPHVNLEGTLTDGEVARPLGQDSKVARVTFRRLTLQAELDSRQLSAAISLDANDMGKLTANISVQPTQSPWPLTGQISLRGLNVAALSIFFPQLTTLTGVIDAQGALGGDLQQPVFTGQVKASAVAIAAKELPLAIHDGQIDVELDGRQANFKASAQVTDGGDLQIQGRAEWSATSWEVVLQVQGDEVTVQQTQLFTAHISPHIELAIAPGKIQVSGELEVPWARVTLQEIPAGVTRVSRDVVIVDAESQTGTGDWQIETNVHVVLGEDVRFSGLGLRAQLSGDLQIDQTESKPVSATGEIVIDEGDYSAYGQKLRITEGRLLFVGSLQPDVSLTAVREVGDVTAGLQLRGTLEHPQTTLFSTPPQTETNTLAYIVLGRPIDLDNREDGRTLTQAALVIGLTGGGRGLATQVAEQFGIQDFEIDTENDLDTGPRVVVRGRLTPDLTVRYGVGVLTPDNVLTLRYDLTEKLYVEVAQGVENAMDFFYSFSF